MSRGYYLETVIFISMIRLASLLREISFGGIDPYATQFTWQLNGTSIESKTSCDGVPVMFVMEPQWTGDEREEYSFAIATKSVGNGYTVTHSNSMAQGQLSYIRLLRTALEAVLDFTKQYAPTAVDVTGFDTKGDKDLQKTRIYRKILQDNKSMITAAGYIVFDRNGKLWLVRSHDYDTTGIRDKQ
jgi:hypothetical protein